MRAMNSQTTTTANPEEDLKQRRIRSFVLRQGRLTKGQEKALTEQWPRFGVEYKPEPMDFSAIFGRADSPKILEIGFGMGETTAKIAQTLPEKDFLGVEVHTPVVGALLKLIEESSIPNSYFS